MFFLFFIVLGILIFAYFKVIKNIQEYDEAIGVDQLSVLATQHEEELFILTAEKAAEFALWDSLEEFSAKGGFISSSSACPSDDNLPIWNNGDENIYCYPNFVNELSKIFDKKFQEEFYEKIYRKRSKHRIELFNIDNSRNRFLRVIPVTPRLLLFRINSIKRLEYIITPTQLEKKAATRFNFNPLSQVHWTLFNKHPSLKEQDQKLMDYYFRPSFKVDTNYDFDIFLDAKFIADSIIKNCKSSDNSQLLDCVSKELAVKFNNFKVTTDKRTAFIEIIPDTKHKFKQTDMPIKFALDIPIDIDWGPKLFRYGPDPKAILTKKANIVTSLLRGRRITFDADIVYPDLDGFIVKMCFDEFTPRDVCTTVLYPPQQIPPQFKFDIDESKFTISFRDQSIPAFRDKLHRVFLIAENKEGVQRDLGKIQITFRS